MSSSQLKRDELLSSISSYLARLVHEVDIKNSIYLFDINQICEDFFRDFLNEVFKNSFKNINIDKGNAASIDLGCTTSKLAIQVTSDTTPAKVRKTIKLFLKNNLDQTYSTLRMLYLKKMPESKVVYQTESKFSLERWDYKNLIKEIKNLKTPEIEKIEKFLSEEFISKIPTQEIGEVQTIIELIDYLSNGTSCAQDTSPAPDPEGKIEKRFNEYAAHLKDIYADLFPIYSDTLSKAEQAAGIDSLKLSKIRPFLKAKSIEVLDSQNDNPKAALTELASFFSSKLSASGKNHDDGAIRFYLITQVIQCNVFPNSGVTQ